MNQDIFLIYLSAHFLPSIKADPDIEFPVVLFVDGAKSHISVAVAGNVSQIFNYTYPF